jgi:SAM-dependent methyltransferase
MRVEVDKISESMICPECQSDLRFEKKNYICTSISCGMVYPIVKNIPILINNSNSVFKIEDFKNYEDTFFVSSKSSKIYNFLKFITPSISKNIMAGKNFDELGKLLLKKNKRPTVLIIGGSIDGEGIKELKKYSKIKILESDVSHGPNTQIIFDSHNIPFKNNTFDCVIVQAVLEHVLDPYMCVEEIHRVLNSTGLVYSEIPFIQQVHGGKYDFTRFTYLGHIRLFRKFNMIKSGVSCGPGMALSWSYMYFLMSFSSNKYYKLLVQGFASFTSFYFKYFDYYLIKKKFSRDSGSGNYYIGEKSDKILSDKKLLELYDL